MTPWLSLWWLSALVFCQDGPHTGCQKKIQEEAILTGDTKQETKQSFLCFDLPDLTICGFKWIGVCVSLIVMGVGFAWIVTWRQIEVDTAEIFNPAAKDEESQKSYHLMFVMALVSETGGLMVLTGFFALIAFLYSHRSTLLWTFTLGMTALAVLCASGTTFIKAWQEAKDQCDLDPEFLLDYYGRTFDCERNASWHDVNMFWVWTSAFLLVFLNWCCIRFSERLQSWDKAEERGLDVSLGDMFTCICVRCRNPVGLYTNLLNICGVIICTGSVGLCVLAYLSGKMDNSVVDSDFFFTSSSYVYGAISLFAAIGAWLGTCDRDRGILMGVFILMSLVLAMGYFNCVRNFMNWAYGVDTDVIWCTEDSQFTGLDGKVTCPPYFADGMLEAVIALDGIIYTVLSLFAVLAVWLSIMASEAIQDERIENLPTNSRIGEKLL